MPYRRLRPPAVPRHLPSGRSPKTAPFLALSAAGQVGSSVENLVAVLVRLRLEFSAQSDFIEETFDARRAATNPTRNSLRVLLDAQ